MARFFYVHWHKEEALETVRRLRTAGHSVQYHCATGEEAWKLLQATPPDALIVSLARLPSHGRQVALATTESKKLRALPVVFVGGEPEKVAKAKQQFPSACFCSPEQLPGILDQLPAFAATKNAGESAGRKTATSRAGYSGTPLVQKLGIKANQRLALLNAPADFHETLGRLPDGVTVESGLGGPDPFDVVLLFTSDRSRLAKRLPSAAKRLAPTGSLWLAWPKKASGVATDLSEAAVREAGLETGLVDNKVCAVDETWSGLRFVVRVKDRPKQRRAFGKIGQRGYDGV